MKATTKKYSNVKVIAWNFSHYTGNGNPVHSFTVETETGLTIDGKTSPNNGFVGHLPSNPTKLSDMSGRYTRGHFVMTDANA